MHRQSTDCIFIPPNGHCFFLQVHTFLEGRVILVVLTEKEFRFSLLLSQLLAEAILVRGAKFRKARFKRAFCFSASAALLHRQVLPASAPCLIARRGHTGHRAERPSENRLILISAGKGHLADAVTGHL